MNLLKILNHLMMNKTLFLFTLLLVGCYRVEDKLEPKLSYNLEKAHIESLPSPFSSLTKEERSQDWAREYIIAKSFAKELDLYRAITNFKRALILLEDQSIERKQQIEYETLFCYYLAKKYDDLIDFFDKSSLQNVDKSFVTFHDLLVILYESYYELKDDEKIALTLDLIEKHYPTSEKKIVLSTALLSADIEKIDKIANTPPKNETLVSLIDTYNLEKKSIRKAQALNGFMPGAGYLYLGQKKSAITAFLLNGLFIYASYEFFHHGWNAAGIITLSFEAGWYFGGIYGAGEEAKFYNERIFERLATPIMNREKYFPIFLIKYGF